MTAISLKIIEPKDDAPYIGTSTVTFRGTVINLPKELENTTLYYRWYSSLNPKVKEDYYSIHEDALTDPGMPYSVPLNLGSHIITFAVTDRSDQTALAMEAVRHGGVTGGAEGTTRCVIHVFKANLVEPTGIVTIQRNNASLVAEAPLAWGQAIPKSEPPKFEINRAYEKINRLQYRWEFIPNVVTGMSDQRQIINFMPSVDQYTFKPKPDSVDPNKSMMTIEYTGALPMNLNGSYRLVLHVEDRLGVLGGHQASISNCTIS